MSMPMHVHMPMPMPMTCIGEDQMELVYVGQDIMQRHYERMGQLAQEIRLEHHLVSE